MLIGLDSGAQLKGCGFAVGRTAGDRVEITEAGLLAGSRSIAEAARCVASKFGSERDILIAIDAPLGWPASMGSALSMHRAGEKVSVSRGELFKRRTDDNVRDRTGKNPLEVGAEKIAHASHHALELLDALRESTGLPIPLAWSPDSTGVRAIEVYPGATLLALLGKRPSYKSKSKKEEAVAIESRRKIAIELLANVVGLERYAAERADVFDACLCLIAAKDFLDGHCPAPDDRELARKEGWIWVRSRSER